MSFYPMRLLSKRMDFSHAFRQLHIFPRFLQVALSLSIGSIVIGSVASLKVSVQYLCLIFNACYTILRSSDWGIFHGVPSMKRNKWRVNKFILFDTMILFKKLFKFNNFSQTLLKTSQQNLPCTLQDLIWNISSTSTDSLANDNSYSSQGVFSNDCSSHSADRWALDTPGK